MKTEYKGFILIEYDDGCCDILLGEELIDGDFASIKSAKDHIDRGLYD
jgi:hypothetical protein